RDVRRQLAGDGGQRRAQAAQARQVVAGDVDSGVDRPREHGGDRRGAAAPRRREFGRQIDRYARPGRRQLAAKEAEAGNGERFVATVRGGGGEIVRVEVVDAQAARVELHRERRVAQLAGERDVEPELARRRHQRRERRQRQLLQVEAGG